MLPTIRDPRLHLAAVIVTVQVLGQVALGFDLSIAQILLSIGTCALLEVAITFWRHRQVVWPASAMLTGNGVALILRVTGTRHGDWWSLEGAHIFVAVAAFSLLSKYVIRVGGRHVFNPSNIGLVACFVLLGSERTDPQDLWWGPMSPGLLLTWMVIVAGGLLITARLRLLALAAAFWFTFAAALAVVAAAGHCMTARWRVGAVCDRSFWSVVVASPEIFVFMLFMITDPRTVPRGRVARLLFGVVVGSAAAMLVAPQRTEFGTKVAVLGALVVGCALTPWLERIGSVVVQRPLAPVRVIGAGALVVASLLAAGHRAREEPDDLASVREFVLDRRPPAVDVDLPDIEIDPAVRDAAPSFTDETAERMARDLVTDLAAAGDALEHLDLDLARTVAAGPWLDELERAIGAGLRGEPVVVPSYSIERVRAVLVQGPDQSSPLVGFEVLGTLREAIVAGSPPTTGASGNATAFDRTFALLPAGRHYLIFSSQ